MNKNNKVRYCLTEEDLKLLKQSIRNIKKLDFFNKDKESKLKKVRKVA